MNKKKLILIILLFLCSSCSNEQEPVSPDKKSLEMILPYSNYTFSQDDHVIDFGDQPYWVPASIVTEYMVRDPILKLELNKHGFILQNHHFLKGADLNYFLSKGDLEVGIAGDMPSISIASSKDVSLLSVFKCSVSIVSKGIRELADLKGKKVGYAFGSNAHFFLLNTLHKNRLETSDITLIEMDILKMANALDQGEIDAYSTWEFTPSTTMKIIQDKITTHKGTSYGFLYIRDAFFKEQPEIVRLLLASQVFPHSGFFLVNS